MSKKKRSTLRLVSRLEKRKPEQLSFFLEDEKKTLALINVRELGEMFVSVIEKIRPQIVFDIRMSPRFNYGFCSRTEAFQTFDKMGVKYLDTLGRTPSVFEEASVLKLGTECTIVVLVDKALLRSRMVEVMCQDLPNQWVCRQYPPPKLRAHI